MKELSIWLLAWFSVWGIWNIIFKKSLRGNKSRNIIEAAYFMLSVLITCIIYYSGFDQKIFYLLLSFLICSTVGLFLGYFKPYKDNIKSGRYYLLIHPFNILFQQLMVYLGINLLAKLLGGSYRDYFFGVVFMSIHLPVIFIKWAKFKYFYLLGAFAGGIFMSHLIRNYTVGIFLSYLIHYAVYIMIVYLLRDQNRV